MRKTDRRSRRTQRWLRNAFLELMLEKSYDAISIQDIADRADTARVTFYRHYPGGKEDLLMDWLDIVYSEVFAQIDPVASADVSLSGKQSPIFSFYRHINENRDLYRVLLSDQIGAMVRGRVQEYLARAVGRGLSAQLALKSSAISLDIMANHVAAAYLGLAVWWLENELPYDAEYLARVSHQLNMAGVFGVIAAGAVVNSQTTTQTVPTVPNTYATTR